MSKDSVRASGAEGPGRLGEGRVYADNYRHGTNPRCVRKSPGKEDENEI